MVTAVTERLVGREAEWEAIRAFLEAGEPEPLVLAGDAGIGKTALWAAAVEAATHAGFRVLRARPEEAERELTDAVLADLALPVRDLVHLLPRPQRRALEVALLLQETRGVPPDARAVGAAFLTLLGEAAAREPLLVALDDLQWVDAPSGLVLRYALRRLDRRIGRVLVATRTGEAAIDLPGADTLRIGPLDTRALDLLFEMHLGTSFVAPTLDRIAEASGGNRSMPCCSAESCSAVNGCRVQSSPYPSRTVSVPLSVDGCRTSRAPCRRGSR